MKNTLLAIFLILFLPAVVFGSTVSITEIMYDAPSGDAGKEWIEVHNNTGTSIDLTQYTFLENGVSHTIKHFSGEELLPNNSYAIIADNAQNFVSTYPHLEKSHIYDSSFSLSNGSGEYIAIKDDLGDIVFSLTYDTAIGANGDGTSLQYNSSSWISGTPNPLSSYIQSQTIQNEENDTTTNKSTNTSGTNTVVTVQPKSMQFVFDTPRTVIAGTKNYFKADFYNASGEKILVGDFVWNFGDGSTMNVNRLDPIEHVYMYPGDYVISCTYRYPWYPKPVVVSRTSVTVISSPFVITKTYELPVPAVGLINNRDVEYDISGYRIRVQNKEFTIHEGTYIGGKDEIVIPLLGFDLSTNSKVELLDVFGTVVSSYGAIPKPDIKNNVVASSGTSSLNQYMNVFQQVEDTSPNVENIILANDIIDPVETTPAGTNRSLYFGLVAIIVVSGACIFFIRKYANN